MADNISLIKNNPLLPAEDYAAMRKQGFMEIEKLGHEQWTDYNNSDPGITILEAVIYAITDLSYRTGFEIKDLLAPENTSGDTWKQVFYTARQILHNSPLTITDYRKIIMDVKGIRNGWIEPSKDYEVPLWADYNYYDKKKDPDCDCEDATPQTCFGRLTLDPATSDLEVFKKERAAKIKAAQTRIKLAIEDAQKKIAAIIAELIKIGENDPLATEALERKKQELEKFKIQKSKENADLDTETVMLNAMKPIASKIIEMEGLYNVMVEYEENVAEEDKDNVRQQVVQRLSAHRNLCEDFLSVNEVDIIEFSIAASIALAEYADPDIVLAQIFFVIYKYFSPSVPFYTINQLREKGFDIDTIFEGPALHHGFIETDAIEKTDLFRDIRLSDIISEIADIPGIKAITYLHLPFSESNTPQENKKYFAAWLKKLKEEKKIAKIKPETSQVIFCKERDTITYNVTGRQNRRPERMLKLFKDLKTAERKYKLEGVPLDLPVPTGENMELESYYPVTYSLPMCYGVSERAGLPADADDIRKKQALQLKGYLLFFEQLLSDHLVQLNHLRQLFSFDESTKHTIYTKGVKEIEDLYQLLVDYGKDDSEHPEVLLKEFSTVLQSFTETENQFNQRRNRFLTHFLARFSEDMSEYDAINRWLVPHNVDQRLVRDKINVLKNGEYYKISSNRGKGYNYILPDYWNSTNVSGTERRVGRLLGFADISRRNLAPDFIISEPIMELNSKKVSQQKLYKGKPLNIIRFLDPAHAKEVLLTSVEVIEGCCTEQLIADIIANADQRKHFKFHDELNQRARMTAGAIGHFWFEVWDGADPKTAVRLAYSNRFEKRDMRDKAYKALQYAMAKINNNEGMHLVEHILLRPKLDEVLGESDEKIQVDLLNICLSTCDLGIGLGEATEKPGYKKHVRRIPADKCYDKMPWILEYFRYNFKTKEYSSILFAQTFPQKEKGDPIPLSFQRYEDLAQRVRHLQEFGSEFKNYRVISNEAEEDANRRYSFLIHDNEGVLLAQSPFVFKKRTAKEIAEKKKIDFDIDEEIANLSYWLGFEMDWFCEADPCDNSEDPYSFRSTIVLPCWPKRLRDATFRNFVEKTIHAQAPAHVDVNVVWLGIAEMQRFEKAYADWLEEMAKTEMPVYEKVNPLVNVLNTLRPCGVCEDDCREPVKEEGVRVYEEIKEGNIQ